MRRERAARFTMVGMPRYAAVDIGSNSIRLLVAETQVRDGRVTIERLAEDREVTRLGACVFDGGSVDAVTMQHVEQVLARMGATCRRLEPFAVRAVATSATRDASNRDEFLARANAALGVPIETISGVEEARLIHLGVETVWPHGGDSILIVDVGGGSAELIAAENGRMIAGYSRPLGAVRLAEVFLEKDPPTPAMVKRLREFVDQKLALPHKALGGRPYQRMIATSASAAAIVCAVNRITRDNRDAADRLRATRPQVRQLFDQLVGKDLAGRRKVPGIGPRRAEIIVPGAAVYLAVLERFGLPAMHYSVAGVRDGLIADLALRAAGQERASLSRDQRRATEGLARRFGVALPHARKVAAHAHALFMGLRRLHQLGPEWGGLLEAAALLRDAGHFVSGTSHHKHSWYLVIHSDLAGFTDRERALVALLCRYHRKAMPGAKHAEFVRETPSDQQAIIRLAPLLRIADALDRGRDQAIESVAVEIENNRVCLRPVGKQRGAALETWAVEQAAADFQTVYNLPLVLR